MCLLNCRFFSIVTPISFSSYACYKNVLQSWYLGFLSFLFPIVITLHLSGWNLSSQLSLQVLSLLRSSCSMVLSLGSVITLKIFVSSAKRYVSELTHVLGQSFMNNTNSNGPSNDPCGIPDVTFFQDEFSPLTMTTCFLSVKKLFTQPWICSTNGTVVHSWQNQPFIAVSRLVYLVYTQLESSTLWP